MNTEHVTEVVGTTHTAPGWWVLLITAIVAGGIVLSSTRVMFVNVVAVVVHEAGHAAAALITGGGVRRIQICSHDSGQTLCWGRSTFSAVAVGAAGYISPALAGRGIVELVYAGRSSAALAIVIAVMLCVLVVSRDLLTVGVVCAVGSLAATLFWLGPWRLHMWSACLLAHLLLFGGAMHLITLTVERYRGASPGPTDAVELEEETGIPVLVWIVGWFFVIGWCLWSSAKVLWW